MLIVVGLLLIPLGAVVFLLLFFKLLCLVSAIRARRDPGSDQGGLRDEARRLVVNR